MFKDTLDKLSIGAKEAVVDGSADTLDAFKEYLHVERQVDGILEDIVLQSIESSKPRLILISGNVGDGKSHLLARLFAKYPQQMAAVKVRNDATESNYVAKTWVEELDEFISSFRDEELIQNPAPQVRIVAINLGILSRFLTETTAYDQLHRFVTEKGILDNLAYENFYHPDSAFQFINLADFKLFTLSATTAESPFLTSLLQKITDSSEDNPFRKAMKSYYSDHPYLNDCIMRFNYRQLSDSRFQSGLVKLIVLLIVRFKLIISIRDLLDFLYDLIVPFPYQKFSGEDIRAKKDYINANFQMSHSIYAKLFESEGRSAIFNALAAIDPVKLRNQKLDVHIFQLGSLDAPELFKKWNIGFCAHYEQIVTQEQRKAQVKAFVRALFLNHIEEFSTELGDFERYCKYLFCYHVGNKDGLMQLYTDVIRAIQSWNGHTQNGEIHIPMGEHQILYNITQKTKLGGRVVTFEKKEQHSLSEFETSFPLIISVSKTNEPLTMDFNLYTLIRKVVAGYCPSRLDREDHIDFQKFVETITHRASDDNDEIYFEDVNGGLQERFELKRSWNGYHFEKI